MGKKVATKATKGGNSTSPLVDEEKQEKKKKCFLFTYYFPGWQPSNHDSILEVKEDGSWSVPVHLLKLAEKAHLVMQPEFCPETGRLHLQGFVAYKTATTWNTCRRDTKGSIRVMSSRADVKDNLQYCTKPESRVPGTRPFVAGFIIPKPPRPIEDPLERYGLRPWQAELKQMLSQPPDDRTILWVLNPEGLAGKSKFILHMRRTEGPSILNVVGKLSDIAYKIKNNVDENIDVGVVCIDIPKTQKYCNYNAMEQIKNGYIFSSKYESTDVMFASPHLVVFSNSIPDTTQFTSDRLQIYSIVDMKLQRHSGNFSLDEVPLYNRDT